MSALIKRDAGRPSTYNPEIHLAQIQKMMATGQTTMTQVAAGIGVDRTTLWRWSKEYPEIEQELNIGKTVGEAHLTDVLYQIATGKLKGNPTAAMMILNNCYGWRSGSGENGGSGNTYIQNNISLTYDQINDELQKYLDKMGVRNLKDLQDSIIEGEFE